MATAHASITALEHHFRRDDDGRLTVDVEPPFKSGVRLATLDMACEALFGACIGASHLLGGTSQNDALQALWERFAGQGRRAAVEG
jgi:hypothetical protein